MRPARSCSSSAARSAELEGASSDGVAAVVAGSGIMQTSVIGGAVVKIDGVVATGVRGHSGGTSGTVRSVKVAPEGVGVDSHSGAGRHTGAGRSL